MFKIKIKNFQSLTEGELDLEDGLTIVTGATNNGKSAIVRAVDAAIFNNGSDEHIKAGTDEMVIELDNGKHSLRFVRKAKGRTDKTTYQFDNGEVQQKVGRNQLPETEKFFNIREVRLQNNQKARLNFWHQNEKPFLMDKTSGQLYEFLSVSSSERYLTVLRAMMADMKQEDTDIKELTIAMDTQKKELVIKQDMLDKNQGFYTLFDKITTLKNDEEAILKADTIVAGIKDVEKGLADIRESVRRNDVEYKAVPMEDLKAKMKVFLEKIEEFKSIERLFIEVVRAHENLSGLKEKVKNASRVESYCADVMKQLEPRIEHVFTLQEEVAVLATKVTECNTVRKEVKASIDKLKKTPIELVSLERIKEIDKEILNIEEGSQWLIQRREKVKEIIASGRSMNESLNKLEGVLRDLEASDKEMDTFKAKIGVCPFCGASFGNNHVCDE